jgi:hypothetical protein
MRRPRVRGSAALVVQRPTKVYDEERGTPDELDVAATTRPCSLAGMTHRNRVSFRKLGLTGDIRRPCGQQKTRLSGLFLERMKGLEPSTFCMARAGDRSRAFA